MTTDFKASQVQTNKVIVTGSFAGGSANQLLVYNYNADDSGTPNQGIIDAAVFDTSSGIGSDVFLFVSGAIGSKNTANTYGVAVVGGDLHVSGNLTVGGTYPAGGGGGDQYWSSTTAASIFTTGSVLIRSNDGSGKDSPIDYGSDVFFFVSGSVNNQSNKSVFGGQVFVSGNIEIPFDRGIRSRNSASNAFTDLISLRDGSSIGGGKNIVAIGEVGGSGNDGIAFLQKTAPYVIALITGSNQGYFSGSYKFHDGLSGSLTKLPGGSNYLIAGPYITLTTNSIGQVEITGTAPGGGGGGDQYWYSTENKAIFTTGSALFRGPGGVTGGADAPSDLGQDIFFYVSGAIGSKDSAVTGTAVFGGDVVISGTLYGGSPLKISGSLQQGRQTQAIGRDSHAAGRDTEASGSYSYAGGYGTITSGSYQTVVGQYNQRDNPDSLFVVGNGLADPNVFRKDVLRVNGNIAEWPLGRVEVTGTLAATSTVTAVNLTGSLTQLSNGDPYLIAGDGVTIASGSDLGGAVKVSSTDWMTVTLGHSASLVSSNPIYIGQAQGLTAGGLLPTSGNASAWTYRSHVSGTIRKVSVMFHDSVGLTSNSGSFSIINVTPTPDSSSTIDAAFDMGGKQTVNRVYTLASALDINPDDEITIKFQPSPTWSPTRYMWGSYNLLIQVTGSISQW